MLNLFRKKFNIEAYRQRVHRTPTLPSCGQQVTVRVLTVDEVRAVMQRHDDAADTVEAQLRQNGKVDEADLLGSAPFVSFMHELVSLASVDPRIVMEPTLKRNQLSVFDLTSDDLNAIFAVVIPRELQQAAKVVHDHFAAKVEDEEAEQERKARENEAVARAFTSAATVKHMTGQ